MSSEGTSQYVDALTIALKEACRGGEKRWYTSTLELQLASLELCRACRRVPTLVVCVDDQTPRTLWYRHETDNKAGSDMRSLKVHITSRVHVVRALGVEWELSRKVLMRSAAMETWEGSLERIWFGHDFNERITGVVWPVVSLQKLSLGVCFNQPVARVAWPASLWRLSFGDHFNQPIVGVVWPASLQELSFGYRFNQPIDGVVWPTSLKQLSFGNTFNQPIAGVVWPASLPQLSFGFFDQPIVGVM